jgi:D-alanyl-D-alanine carboxypeptidase
MQSSLPVLLNTSEVEIWPAALLRARSNRDARILARADHVLRRKRDGAYLAATLPEGLMPLLPRWQRAPGLDEALATLEAWTARRAGGLGHGQSSLPLQGLDAKLDELGIDADDYAARTGLSRIDEPAWLVAAGVDRYRRPLWLLPGAARAWQGLRHAAARDDVALDAVSGYRSHDYQLGIFERKRARGQDVAAILQVNAAPGFSEHHAGTALDISAPGEPPAETSFESTPAFAWLTTHAAAHGFTMSYPRDNPHGIVYEPWHWRYRSALD